MEPTSELRAARRELSRRAGIELEEDLEWVEPLEMFSLRFNVDIGRSAPHLPARTTWYALIDPTYPIGSLALVPAKEGGIQRTFPHQSHNGPGSRKYPWRRGNVCVDIWGDRLVRGSRKEPMNGSRLLWRVDRLGKWLDHAVDGRLFAPGTAFELPEYPLSEGSTIGYAEDDESYRSWCGTPDRHGVVELAQIGKAYCARRFRDESGLTLVRADLGRRLTDETRTMEASWIRLDGPLHLEPWHAPTTWGELRSTVPDRELSAVLRSVRTTGARLLLIGMPIPEEFGGPAVQMHWQTLRLPRLTPAAKGLKQSRRKLLQADLDGPLQDEAPLEWLRSENWSRSQLSRRRSDGVETPDIRVLLIGCGSLGSMVAEILVRSGVRRLTLVDRDVVTGGVLVRTALSMDDLGENKAVALARKLNSSAPHAQVNAVAESFNERFDDVRGKLATIVVDCTAEDAVLRDVVRSRLGSATLYSFSLGREAASMYVLRGRIESFDPESAIAAIAGMGGVPATAHEPRSEGIGCHDPAFPADVDRVWGHAARAAAMVLGHRDDVTEQIAELWGPEPDGGIRAA